jgi:hypothetical protein
MQMLTRILVLAAAAAGLAMACADPPYRGPMRGRWTLSMTLETALPGRTVPPGTTVRGKVTVPDPTPLLPRSFPGEVPADVDLDLAPFGLALAPASQPVVRDLDAGGVRLDLGSTPNELVLTGRLRGDSVTGIWSDEFRAGGAVGRFVMRRVR